MSSRRDALREFYKLKNKQKAAETEEEVDVEKHQEVQQKEDVDKDNFDPKAYVDGLVESGTIEELLHREVTNLQEIYTLESEKKALVYNNYNRFMSTTNTISDLLNKLTPALSEFSKVENNVGEIKGLLQTVSNEKPSMNEEDKDNKSQSTFDAKLILNSPARLSRLMELNEPEKAQHLLDQLLPIFKSMQGMDDVEEIQQKCLDICQRKQPSE